MTGYSDKAIYYGGFIQKDLKFPVQKKEQRENRCSFTTIYIN
jgi:hypothetical protein